MITTSSKYYSGLTIANAVGVTQVSNFRNSVNNERIVPTLYVNDTIKTRSSNPIYYLSNYTGNGKLIYNYFSFSAYRLLKQSKRDINPKWGQELFVGAYNTPYGGDYSGSLFSIYGVAFIPGLFKHHSLWAYWAYQNSLINSINYKYTSIPDNGNYQF
ncbi:MAG: hypothetical protein QM734_02345 [Cyclobacteriaceae bacterium]